MSVWQDDWTDALQGIIDGINAPGIQVASLINSQGAFSASSQLPYFHSNRLFVPKRTVHLFLPSPLFNTILLCELVLVMFTAIILLLNCYQCLDLNFNPTTLWLLRQMTEGKT